MKTIEKKARQIVRETYNEYIALIHYGYVGEESQIALRTYQAQMDMLKELFPKTTNQDALENMWDAMWRKENRDY